MLMDGKTGLSGRIVPLLVAKELEGATAYVPDHYTREKDVPCLQRKKANTATQGNAGVSGSF